MKWIVVSVLAVLSGNAAHAAGVRLETPETDTSPAVVTVTGRFDKTDYNAFVAITQRIKRATVFFHSKGGWLHDAILMSVTIRTKGYNTAVADHQFCYSACAIAWLGGRKRFLGYSAKIGFHAPHKPNGERDLALEPLLAKYLRTIGFSADTATYVLAPDPKDMVYVRDEIDGKALEYLRGKAAGLYDRLEHSDVDEFARMSDEELRQFIVDQTQALETLGIDSLPAPKANAKKH